MEERHTCYLYGRGFKTSSELNCEKLYFGGYMRNFHAVMYKMGHTLLKFNICAHIIS